MKLSPITCQRKFLKSILFLRPLSSSSSSPSQHVEEEEEPNPITNQSYWTHKIHALCSSDRFIEAHQRLSLLLLSSNWVPNDQTANFLIANLLKSHSTPHLTLQFISHLTYHNPSFGLSVVNHNRLIHRFCNLSMFSEAQRLLFSMMRRGPRPNAVSFTSLINGYVRVGRFDDARKVLDEMRELGVPPNSLTLSVLVKGVFRKRRVEEGKELMAELWARMEEDEPPVRSAAFANLIDQLCKEGFFNEVFRIADEMPQGKLVREEFAYGQMIDSLCRAGKHHGASRIVYIMRKRWFVPSLVSYNNIVHGLSKEKGCMRAYQLFKEGVRFGYSLPEPTYKVLVQALCKENDLNKAKDVMEFMLGRDSVDRIKIYNVFLSALRLVDNPSEQLNVLVLMLQKQCKPDVVTLNTIIHGFCKIGKIMEARKILNDMLEGKFCAPDVVTFTTIIRGLLDVGKSEEALDLLHRVMPEYSCCPNVVTYNVIISGLCKLKSTQEAMKIFNNMAGKGICADNMTYTAIIEGLCEVGQLEEAKKFWDDKVWPSKTHDDYVYAAILRGLCHSGKLDTACDFLYELVDCDVGPGIVNYNILIDAACKLGLKKDAYQIVGEMRKNGLKPDSVTWRLLDKLHDRERAVDFDGSQCLVIDIRNNREEKQGNESGKAADNVKECNEYIEIHGDPLEGLVDPCLFSEVTDVGMVNKEHSISRKANLDAWTGGMFHEQESKLHLDGRRCFETENRNSVEAKLGNKSGKNVDHKERSNDIENHGDRLEGLVDQCLSTKVTEADMVNEEHFVPSKLDLDENVRKESQKPSHMEPLSRIARRVFGVL